jgi:hypothetical protein
MNQATPAAAPSTTLATIRPAPLPRNSRTCAALASVLVTGVLFGSVVMGMTSMGDDAPQIVAQARAGAPA